MKDSIAAPLSRFPRWLQCSNNILFESCSSYDVIWDNWVTENGMLFSLEENLGEFGDLDKSFQQDSAPYIVLQQ